MDTSGSPMDTSSSYTVPQYGTSDASTGPPQPAEFAEQLGPYPPDEDKCSLSRKLLKNMRKSRAELKRIYDEEYPDYVLAKQEGDRLKLTTIQHRWKAAVRKYIIRLVMYGRRVGTMSPQEALRLHRVYSIRNMTMDNMTLDHKDELLALYPPELAATADRAEAITANHGKRPAEELETNRSRQAFAAGYGNAGAASFGTHPANATYGTQPANANYHMQPVAAGAASAFAANHDMQHVPTGPASTTNINRGRQYGGHRGGHFGGPHGGYSNRQRNNYYYSNGGQRGGYSSGQRSSYPSRQRGSSSSNWQQHGSSSSSSTPR
jgi:hypothetical protein